MENFITGYSANESLMRKTVRTAVGDDRADIFFEALLDNFFSASDAAFIAESGFNLVRIPVNYRHLENDARPFAVLERGFERLDHAIAWLGERGVYSVIDLHALPGYQNHHWHSDNPTHVASFWDHPHFQDRVVNTWQAIAARYRDNSSVAGYNLINEPADESRAVIGPFYRRLSEAIRQIDADHVLFLDGNTYATEFDFFDAAADNTVYTLHDYVPAGIGRGAPYDRDAARQKFLTRSAYARATDTPIFVGEFGSIFTGDPAQDELRYEILADQLELYREYDASWTIWTYKDIGMQGLATVRPESAYMQRFGDFVEQKRRLGADQWGSDGEGPAEVTRPVQELVARECPNFDPYPWGRFDFVRTLLLNILVAQPLAYEYAERFKGLDDDQLRALAESFAWSRCAVREPLLKQLQAG
jgi:endoglucanase